MSSQHCFSILCEKNKNKLTGFSQHFYFLNRPNGIKMILDFSANFLFNGAGSKKLIIRMILFFKVIAAGFLAE